MTDLSNQRVENKEIETTKYALMPETNTEKGNYYVIYIYTYKFFFQLIHQLLHPLGIGAYV